LKDKTSHHNLAYWNSNNYLALGASAAGWMAPIRYQNAANLAEYYRCVEAGELYPNQSICTKQRMIEDYLMMGLRRIDGIDVKDFKQRFGRDIDTLYAERIRHLVGLGMLKRDKDTLSLTEAALFVSNSVIAELIL
jgi:oxygen-independent coproporphyrinogen-3 oxidase